MGTYRAHSIEDVAFISMPIEGLGADVLQLEGAGGVNATYAAAIGGGVGENYAAVYGGAATEEAIAAAARDAAASKGDTAQNAAANSRNITPNRAFAGTSSKGGGHHDRVMPGHAPGRMQLHALLRRTRQESTSMQLFIQEQQQFLQKELIQSTGPSSGLVGSGFGGMGLVPDVNLVQRGVGGLGACGAE